MRDIFVHSPCASPSRNLYLPRLHLRKSDDPALPESLTDSPRFPIRRLAVNLPQGIVDRRLRARPMAFSNDANRAREDEWLAQLPTLPYPPTSALQQADTSVLGKMKHQGSNPPTYPHPQPGVGNQLPPIRNLVPGLWEPGTSKQILLDDCKNGPLIYPFRPVCVPFSATSPRTRMTDSSPFPSLRRILARTRVHESSPAKSANLKSDLPPRRLNERTMNGPRLRIASLILKEGPSAIFKSHHRGPNRSEKTLAFDLAPARRLRSQRANARGTALSPRTSKKYFETQ